MTKVRIHLAVLLCLLCLPWQVQALGKINQIFVFGDSLSDNGNFASVFPIPLPDPPYYNSNRASDGLLAVERVASHLGLSLDPSLHLSGPVIGNNYAVASARAGRDEYIDLTAQVDQFLASHNNLAPVGALYVFFIGGNDVISAHGKNDPSKAQTILNSGVKGIIDNIERLSSFGANHFILVNVPDIGTVPYILYKARDKGDPALIARATLLSKQFNIRLKKGAQRLRNSREEFNLIEIDSFIILNALIRFKTFFGFTNTSDACFILVGITPKYHKDCDFKTFFFFDDLHLTAKTNYWLSRFMIIAVTAHHSRESEGL